MGETTKGGNRRWRQREKGRQGAERTSVRWRVILLGWFILAVPGHAQVLVEVGTEFQVNSYTTGSQSFPELSVDDSGEFVVVWSGAASEDGDGLGVFGQRYDSGGNALGTEFQVNSSTTGRQGDPVVAADGDGDFVVVWTSAHLGGAYDDIFGQRYDSAGTPVGGEFQINFGAVYELIEPSVASDEDGDFVVVWSSLFQDGNSYGVFGRRYASNGDAQGTVFQVNTTTASGQTEGVVAMQDDGDFVVVWRSNDQDGHEWGIFGQFFGSDGTPVGNEFQVNATTIGTQDRPGVAVQDAGGFVVVWESDDGHVDGIFGRRLDESAALVGGEFQVNTTTTNNQLHPRVALDASGDFTVVWDSNLQDGDSPGSVRPTIQLGWQPAGHGISGIYHHHR